ncbi:hypothetical protein HGA07_29740 [Nocardia veterana]|uniref:Uncharacterized protein n=1 Tax=Nocardia veterana TaxID=132249 RepID=A0A7X6M5V4_9NOCA|nr:hypothetical protein [Nocardia veterana]
MLPGSERARILITVKAYPAPSERYGETVCVAGVRIDRLPPTWIRLYPMRFRGMGRELVFDKYDIVEVDVRKRLGHDPRIESYQPDQQSLQVLGHVGTSGGRWTQRRKLIGPLIGATSTCELIRANPKGTMAVPAPSLGLVKPIVDAVTVKRGNGWTPQQLRKVQAAAAPSLFDDAPPMLEPMPYRVIYSYRCTDMECGGHSQQCLDWEIGQAGRKWQQMYGSAGARQKLREKWEQEICAPERDLYFFIGNQALRRRSFEVLGAWYPKVRSSTGPEQLTIM